MILTQERLKELLYYDPDTGIFTWKVSSGGTSKGDIAGSPHNGGYIQMSVDGKHYMAHRLAFLYMEGYMPEHEIDHKKGIRHDNRWKELRHATRSCNMQNQKIQTRNTSGFPGVSLHRCSNKWKVAVCLNQKRIFLGFHETILDAALARFTFEDQCCEWNCNYQGELVKAIIKAWPEFKHVHKESK